MPLLFVWKKNYFRKCELALLMKKIVCEFRLAERKDAGISMFLTFPCVSLVQWFSLQSVQIGMIPHPLKHSHQETCCEFFFYPTYPFFFKMGKMKNEGIYMQIPQGSD